MAERRMFAKSIVTSDDFLDMPTSARCLYFTLGMFADDDGFVNSPKSIMRQVGATSDDMNILLVKKYVIAFESGVIVIRHWRIHNYVRGDRYNETIHLEEKNQLTYSENGKVYEQTVEIPTGYTDGIPMVDTGKVRVGKDRVGKDRVDDIHSAEIDEIVAYLNEMTGQHYRPESKETRKHIKARLSEGFTVDDFKTVIYKKAKEWKGTEFQKFLRPQTLFSDKFEAYLNQTEIQGKNKSEQFYDDMREWAMKGD